MTERRFQLAMSAFLLALTAWYGVQMASYPANAGRVPVIVALVMAGALSVQIVRQWRGLKPADGRRDVAPDGSGGHRDQQDDALPDEGSAFEELLALDKARRHRFILIAAFSVLFYVSAMFIGFVLTTGILITAFMVAARERLLTALSVGAVSAAAVYALVVVVLGLPALDGYLF